MLFLQKTDNGRSPEMQNGNRSSRPFAALGRAQANFWRLAMKPNSPRPAIIVA
jgi:hypothetical protein